MIQIEDLIEKVKKDNLKCGCITYDDELDDSKFKKEIGIKYWFWKYYSGSILKGEHESCKKNCDLSQQLGHLIQIYDYIFYGTEADKELTYNTELLDVLSQLWIMRPRNHFKYEEQFKKLIFFAYEKTRDSRFREIALDYKEKSDNQSEDASFLICSKNPSEDYIIYEVVEQILSEC